MTIEQQIAAARNAATVARDNRVRAEAARDQAVAAEEQVSTALTAEFGVHTLDEADALLAQIEAQIATELQAVAGHLGQVMP
jgi:hypothetical protein